MGTIDLLAQVAVTRANLALLDWMLPGRPEARRAALDISADALVSKIDSPDRLLKVIADYEWLNRCKENAKGCSSDVLPSLGQKNYMVYLAKQHKEEAYVQILC